MISTRKSRFPFLTIPAVLFTLLLFTSGCAVGPKFKKPAAPDVSDYTPAPITTTTATPDVAGGEAQHLAEGGDIPGDWWTSVSFQAAQRLDRTRAESQSRSQSGASGVAGSKRECAGPAGCLLSQCVGQFLCDARQNFQRTFACAERQLFFSTASSRRRSAFPSFLMSLA